MTEANKEPKPILLLVDDEVINIDILIEDLGEDFAVRVATDGAAALESVKKALPDLILLDVMMPGMDGFEVCHRLKADPASRDVPIIFLTALNETSSKLRGFSVGGADYVTKPFQFKEVRARIEAHLELHRQRRELQRSYDKLRELEQLRDSLVHMIVHDMRTPLAIVLGYLELAGKEPMEKSVANYICRAMSSTETLMEMVSTLLDVSKMEAGQMTLEFSEVDLGTLVSETIQMVEPLKEQRSLAFTPSGEMAPFKGDMGLIRRILQNLIGNALKFTDRDNGVITVRVESAAENMVRVSIVDNGHGIAPEYHEKVFDKFCQVAARKQGQRYSTGLGLTFCKLAVETLGGRIGLESEVGKGSTFWFELPRR